MLGSPIAQPAFAIITHVCRFFVRIRNTSAHALASSARSRPNTDEEERGLEPVVHHLKAQELRLRS